MIVQWNSRSWGCCMVMCSAGIDYCVSYAGRDKYFLDRKGAVIMVSGRCSARYARYALVSAVHSSSPFKIESLREYQPSSMLCFIHTYILDCILTLLTCPRNHTYNTSGTHSSFFSFFFLFHRNSLFFFFLFLLLHRCILLSSVPSYYPIFPSDLDLFSLSLSLFLPSIRQSRFSPFS